MMKKMSLSYKITMGFLISFCLPLTIFLVVWMYQMTYIQEQSVESQVNNDLAGITGEISHRIQEMEITARSIASNPELIDYLENYSHDPERYLLKAVGEFGMLLGSISQMNPRIESLRIYAVDNRIPRYQNTIYPKRVMRDQEWMEPVENLGYEEFYVGHSALLYEAQNEENYRQLVFPTTGAGPRVFSLFCHIYRENSTTPAGYLEICMRIEDLLGVADTLLEGVDVFFKEEDTGILYSLQGDTEKEEALLRHVQEEGTKDFHYNGQSYRVYEYELSSPALTLFYTYPMSLYHSTLHWGVWLVVCAILVSSILMLVFIRIFFRSVPLRLRTLVSRMQQVRDGAMEVSFEDDQDDEISEVNRTLEQMLRHIHTLIHKVYRTELSEKEATLRFLKMQMDPHFLFNALEAIRMTVALGDNDKVEEALVALSNILRLRLKGNAWCTVEEEVNAVREYVKVENLRYNDHILLQIETDETLLTRRMPSLTIQPLVNNAIRHGFRRERQYLMIRVEIFKEEGSAIRIRVTDDGGGMTPEQLTMLRGHMKEGKSLEERAEHGTGLVNLALRLRLNFGEKADIEVESIEGSGTQVEIFLEDLNENIE